MFGSPLGQEDDMDKPATFMAAMRHFFEFKEGQTLTQFAAEVKALNEDERRFFTQGLIANGYPITSVVPPA